MARDELLGELGSFLVVCVVTVLCLLILLVEEEEVAHFVLRYDNVVLEETQRVNTTKMEDLHR